MAPTDSAASMLTAQVRCVPLQAPLQLPNARPEPAVAVRVTVERAGKTALQADGQLIPAGLEETAPWPETASVRGLAKSAATGV